MSVCILFSQRTRNRSPADLNIETSFEAKWKPLVSGCLAEMLRPVIERKLLELKLSKGGETMEILRRSDIESLSSKDILKMYLRLTKEEKEEK